MLFSEDQEQNFFLENLSKFSSLSLQNIGDCLGVHNKAVIERIMTCLIFTTE